MAVKRSSDQFQSYYLIEASNASPTMYYCQPGQWCTCPDHAFKFRTWEAAMMERQAMPVISDDDRENMHITQHSWSD